MLVSSLLETGGVTFEELIEKEMRKDKQVPVLLPKYTGFPFCLESRELSGISKKRTKKVWDIATLVPSVDIPEYFCT